MTQRIITGIILILLVILGVLLTPPPVFIILSLIVLISLGGWEWAHLVSYQEIEQGIFTSALVFVALAAYYFIEYKWLIITLGILAWVIILLLLASYKKGSSRYKENKWILRQLAYLVLIPAWLSLVTLHQEDPELVLYLIFLIAIADSGAYFTGKAFGKHKLAPELSPGKTKEGAFGGLLLATLWAICGAIYFELASSFWPYFIILSMLVAALSVTGDLFESLIKREAGEKDSGTILPGHGGILDRVDGLLAALPLFTLGIYLASTKL